MDNNNNQNTQAFIRKNKNILVLVAAVAVVIVLAILVSYSRTSAPAAPAEDTTAEMAADEAVVAPAATNDFDAVYKSYEGKRFVISGECAMAPEVLTVSPDTTIMAFNDSSTPREILIDGAAYKVGVKKYRTVRISQAGSFAVGCDGTSNVATIVSR